MVSVACWLNWATLSVGACCCCCEGGAEEEGPSPPPLLGTSLSSCMMEAVSGGAGGAPLLLLAVNTFVSSWPLQSSSLQSSLAARSFQLPTAMESLCWPAPLADDRWSLWPPALLVHVSMAWGKPSWGPLGPP
uniref:Putative secreted protein n=1 Tax=Ixodes ricinus TaxID=34613 RepID=A0A6B0URD3_IXORI